MQRATTPTPDSSALPRLCSHPSPISANTAPRRDRGLACVAVAALSWTLLFGCRRSGSVASGVDPLSPPAPDAVLRGILDRQHIGVDLETDRGVVHCIVDAARAPNGAALFVGFATGRAAYRDPRTSAVVRRPLYARRRFFRAIPDVYVQTGCPLDDGTGDPGYRIAPEPQPDDAARLREPGALLFARYTPPRGRVDPSPPEPGKTIGSQFVITLVDMHHLAGTVTVLGSCTDLNVVREIAEAVGRHDPPELSRVTVRGEGAVNQ
jgi:cyclophilin family peptidyl-prolyl cis-trans isomerase